MTQISKFRKMLIGNSAIETVIASSLVPSVSAAEQFNNQGVRLVMGSRLSPNTPTINK